MTRRSRAREVALQLLFQRDMNADVPRRAIEQFVRDRLGVKPDETGHIRQEESQAIDFCLGLYDGVAGSLKTLDTRIAAASENWKLHRMAASDRNVLRLGAFELVYAIEPTPAAVALDEAIELARRYGSKDSPSFVNGVLDKVFRVFNEEKEKANPKPPAVAVVAEAVG